MFLSIIIVVTLSSFFGALVGRRLSARDRRNITISLTGNLLASQKSLYLIRAVEELQVRMKDLDKKDADGQIELMQQLVVQTANLERLVRDGR